MATRLGESHKSIKDRKIITNLNKIFSKIIT